MKSGTRAGTKKSIIAMALPEKKEGLFVGNRIDCVASLYLRTNETIKCNQYCSGLSIFNYVLFLLCGPLKKKINSSYQVA